jgi:uncharacterized Zn-binding protein involved in type VI secretion
MPYAARVADSVSHPTPPVLTGSLGSPNVSIGGRPAWRALPAALGAAVDAASAAVDAIMNTPVTTPVDAEIALAKAKDDLSGAANAAQAEGVPGARALANTTLAALDVANDALVTTWNTASAAPGGQPAANEAYGEALQLAVAAAAIAIFAPLAALFDVHNCAVPVPPHGPGFVTVGSSTVSVNNLPLARKGDSVMEAAGGANPISSGCLTVSVG